MRLASLLAFAVCLFAVSACDLVERPPLERFFGTPYVVLEDQLPGGASNAAQPTPFLDQDGLLYLTVSYSGGCADHRFRLQMDLLETAATIWFIHADNGDACGGDTIEPLVLQLPAAVLERPTIILSVPGGNEVVLRDGPAAPSTP